MDTQETEGFDTLGLTTIQSQALTALVRARALRVDQLSGVLGCTAEVSLATLEHLSDLGLAARRVEEPTTFVASRPSVALGALLAGRQAGLRQVEAAIEALDHEYVRAQRAQDPADVVDVVLGPEAVAARLQQIQLGARHEVLSLVKAPISVVSSAENTAEDVAVERGVVYRVVLERAMLEEEPLLLEEVMRVESQGTQARVAATVPLKLFVVDRELAFVPLTSVDVYSQGALLIHRSGLLDALVALFDSVWRDAFPLTRPALEALDLGSGEYGAQLDSLLAGVQGPDDFDLRVLALLMVGLTDHAVANALRVSTRTVQRRVRAMMTMAHVDSRLQLGAVAARRGWIEEPDAHGPVDSEWRRIGDSNP